MAQSLYLFAFASGAAALVYQMVWSRLLALSFGATTLAVSAVVAGFMGGMGIGAGLYHRANRRLPAPLPLYGWLELAIAASALALTVLLGFAPKGFAALASSVPSGPWTDLLRVACTFVLLLLPAMLMGATYPALCTVLIRSREDADRHLGAIYGLNTLGAATGAILAGFVTIEALGLRGSTLLAFALNVSVGVAALALARRSPSRPAVAGTVADEALPSRLPRWIVGIVLFASGYTTLAYEIVWFRALSYLVGNSTYALTNALVVFLLGLGLGALLYRFALRRVRPERTLALCQLATAALALAAIGAEYWILSDPALHERVSIFSPLFRVKPWWWRLAVTSGVSLAIMLPATLLMGLSFPIASRLFLDRVGEVDRRTGGAYLISNLGSILGSVTAALVILPTLGIVGGVRALAAVNVLVGLSLFAVVPEGRRRALPAAAVLAAGIVFAGTLVPPRLPMLGDGLVQRVLTQVLFESEGDLANVQVRSTPDPRQLGMVIDGTVIGVSRGWLPSLYEKQVLLAHLPMALDPSIRTTLNVGLASASTVAALAIYPEVETLEAVEINRAAVDGVHLFEESAVLDDPRTRVEIEDAVHHLLLHPGTYDLVISDGKQNEDFSGTARILSREFYLFAAESLRECGLLVQWIPVTTGAEEFKIVLRTLLAVFPEVEVFLSPPNNFFMTASRCPIAGRRLAAPPLPEAAQADLAASHLSDVDALLALWVASGSQLRALVGDGPQNTIDRMPLEFSAYRRSGSSAGGSAANIELLIRAREVAPSPTEALLAPPGDPTVEITRLIRQAHARQLAGHSSEAVRLAREATRIDPSHDGARTALRTFTRQQGAP